MEERCPHFRGVPMEGGSTVYIHSTVEGIATWHSENQHSRRQTANMDKRESY